MAPSRSRQRDSLPSVNDDTRTSSSGGVHEEGEASIEIVKAVPPRAQSAADSNNTMSTSNTMSTCSTSEDDYHHDHYSNQQQAAAATTTAESVFATDSSGSQQGGGGGGEEEEERIILGTRQQRNSLLHDSFQPPIRRVVSGHGRPSSASSPTPANVTLPHHLVGMGISIGVPAKEVEAHQQSTSRSTRGTNVPHDNTSTSSHSNRVSPLSTPSESSNNDNINTRPATKFPRAQSQPTLSAPATAETAVPSSAKTPKHSSSQSVSPLGRHSDHPPGSNKKNAAGETAGPSSSNTSKYGSSQSISPLGRHSDHPPAASSNNTNNANHGPDSFQRQSSMSDRLTRIRSAASNRDNNGLSKKLIRRSKSDVPRHMYSGGGGGGTRSNENKDQSAVAQHQQKIRDARAQAQARCHSSSPVAKYAMCRETGKDEFGRMSSMPKAGFRRSLTANPSTSTKASIMERRGKERAVRRRSLMDVAEEAGDEDEGDVLMLIAKAKAKLEMEGEQVNGDTASRVLEQLEEAQQEEQIRQLQHARADLEHQKAMAAVLGSSGGSGSTNSGTARSRVGSVGSLGGCSLAGTASLPGAYEKVPGGKFERKESFSHTSITQHSESAQMMRAPPPVANSNLHADNTNFGSSDSISSGESGSMSDVMEIEFSQQSFSNHEDIGDHDDKKPAAIGDNDDSVCASLATRSINPDDLFASLKKPAKNPVDRVRRPRRSKSTADQSIEDDDVEQMNQSLYASMASIPSSAMASAPSTLIDDDSDDNSVKQRRRQRRASKRSDRRRRRKSEVKTTMKDTSGGSNTSQLAIAAEVVRSEEEMVHELRQKVEKEILESMAEELIKMEASVSALSAADLDASHATLNFDPMTASPRLARTGTRGGRTGHRLSAHGNRQSHPSPMAAPLSAAASQKRRKRGINLTGLASPKFFRGASRGQPLKQQRMPQLAPSSLDGNSSGSDSYELHRTHSAGSLHVVDALEVIPASPTPRRVQSQPMSNFQSGSRQRQRAPQTSTTAELSPTPSFKATGTNGTTQSAALFNQLNQLRSLSTAAPQSPPVVSNLGRQQSDASLPDLAPSPASRNDSSGGDLILVGEQNTAPAMISNHGQTSSSRSIQEYQQTRVWPRSQTSLIQSDSDDNSDIPNSDVNGIPSDWQLQRMEAELELAERGLHRSGSASTFSLARQSSGLRRNASVEAPANPVAFEDPMIRYDDRLPATWVAPVGVLVAGAFVLGVILFAV